MKHLRILVIGLFMSSTLVAPNMDIVICEEDLVFYSFDLPVIEVFPVDEQEKILLTKLINSESRGEPESGQFAAGQVTLNRADRKGKSIRQIIYARGQFDGKSNKYFRYDKRNVTDRKISEVAHALLAGYRPIPKDIIYFHNPKTSTDRRHINKVRKDLWKVIANHEFCFG